MTLSGKAVLVTGGGRGIGRAIATACAEAGADVAVIGRTQSEIDRVAADISAMGRIGAAENCDVTQLSDVNRAITSAVERLGRLDVLVNNAGGGTERTLVGDDDPASWVQAIEVNLHGTYFCTRAALPHIKAVGGGKIINVGSGMGHQPRRGNSSYNAAKAGVWMLTRCLAMELSEDGIEVNELIPGPVHTELTADVFPKTGPHPQIEGELIKRPEDVVPIAMFLATHHRAGRPASHSVWLVVLCKKLQARSASEWICVQFTCPSEIGQFHPRALPGCAWRCPRLICCWAFGPYVYSNSNPEANILSRCRDLKLGTWNLELGLRAKPALCL